jgi:hypothetical protein
MNNILTFIIPVRHPDNARNWAHLKKNLSETIRSISLQDNENWKVVIVANHGADLPPLPSRVDVKWVDFPPNKLHEQNGAKMEQFYEAIRIDKGRRVLAGMLHAGEMGHVMIVDDDDFVSRRLTSFVAKNQGKNGWYIRNGYVWEDGSILLYLYSDFSKFCGSSYIIRSDLYQLPQKFEDASDTYIRRMLGSHIFIHEYLDSSGTPLKPLPFTGAVYRVGHVGAHSKSTGVISQFFLKKFLLRRPFEFCRRLLRLRLLTKSVREEFFT